VSDRDDVQWALDNLRKRAADIERYGRYYDGDHGIAFATQRWRRDFGVLFDKFRDNLCPAVVNALTDRLQLTALRTSGVDTEQADAETGERPTDPNAEDISVIWRDNRMDRRTGEVHLEAAKKGDGYLIVWPRGETSHDPVMMPQRSERMVVDYDEDDERAGSIRVAGKVWPAIPSAKQWRLNLYYRDRITKWISAESSTTSLPDKATAFRRITGGADELANPYGVVPVFHFANDASVGEYGHSELADVAPIQDALNKSVADMLVAMEFQALPQRWIAGLEPMFDPEHPDRPVEPFEPGADRIWQFVSEHTKAGQFDAADLRQFIAVQDSFRAETARVSRTPLHYLLLSGTFPSGEALRAAEAPLEAKAEDRRGSHGETWEDAFAFALRIRRGESAQANLTAVWADTASKSPKDEAETVTLKRGLGISERQGLRELGYTEDDIDRMEIEKEAEGGTNAQAAAGTPAGATAFDQGTATGEPGQPGGIVDASVAAGLAAMLG
jgi:hypothetical protein